MVMIKGRWPRSKVGHCDLIVVAFGPFKKKTSVFHYLGMEFKPFL